MKSNKNKNKKKERNLYEHGEKKRQGRKNLQNNISPEAERRKEYKNTSMKVSKLNSMGIRRRKLFAQLVNLICC